MTGREISLGIVIEGMMNSSFGQAMTKAGNLMGRLKGNMKALTDEQSRLFREQKAGAV